MAARNKSEEQARLTEPFKGSVHPWRKWGTYVAERSWGTVREDYSADGDSWNYFPFGESHKRAYRWGEDGIAGWCDRYQLLVFAPAFWNGRDPILKERLFGLSSWDGNHGEDVKECYYYLDATPTHSYAKYLYKYPQAEFPYQKLKEENQKRGVSEPEYELVDTGVFRENRYFDIFIEYAKASPEDMCVRIEAFNRGPEDAPLHILPHLWFRNQWSWGEQRLAEPQIKEEKSKGGVICLIANDEKLHSPANLQFDYHLGLRYLYGPSSGKSLFTNNESAHLGHQFAKDGIERAVIRGEKTVNPDKRGTKACLHYFFEKVPAGGSVVLHLRLTAEQMKDPLAEVDKIVQRRKKEADEFYKTVHPKNATAEECAVERQALAGILWNKQIYLFDVNLWLDGDNPKFPPPASRAHIRNYHWRHLNSMRILTMPDKWEFPWFAAWDLAFHTLTLALVDLEFAKEQLWLLLFDQFQHPNGQIPAYEWEFSDLNPPIQAWAALYLYRLEEEQKGKGDDEFLEKCFLKLLLNFVWWVNRVDSDGLNVFEGGFLGMDNITFVDRSASFETGVVLRQSDGTGWMAMFCLNLMRIALEMAKKKGKNHEKTQGYESIATKFFQHFVYIAHAMKRRGNQEYEMWSEKDGFFYDVLSYKDGKFSKFRVRSLVGLIPLFAVEILTEKELEAFPAFKKDFDWFLAHRDEIVKDCVVHTSDGYLLSLVSETQLKSVLEHVWDPEEFRSPFGVRSLSKFHEKNPFSYKQWQVGYEPGCACNKLKGGNSNWRGPVWIAMNFLLIVSLRKFGKVYKDKLQISVKDEKSVDLEEMVQGLTERLLSIFLPDAKGARPLWGPEFPFAQDPHWNYPLFYEYFHGETGQGLGASHQTGWSALIANLIDERKT